MDFLGLPTIIHEFIFSILQADESDLPSFLALRASCKQLTAAANQVLTSISFTIADLDKVMVLIPRLENVSTLTIRKETGYSFNHSLTMLSNVIPDGQLTHLSLVGIQQSRRSMITSSLPAHKQTSLDLTSLTLPWCSELTRLELCSVDCGTTFNQTPSSAGNNNSSCFTILSKLSALESLNLKHTSPPLILEDLQLCTSLRHLSCCSCMPQANAVIPHLPLLENLIFSQNTMPVLDVSGCTILRSLHCSANLVSGINVSGCCSLELLDCSHNPIAALDISSCTRLTDLDCSSSLLSNLTLPFDSQLQRLDCSHNILAHLDLTFLSRLQCLICSNNDLSYLQISNNSAVQHVSCSHNKLDILDLTGAVALRLLDCSHNTNLASLLLSENTQLQHLTCSWNSIDTLSLLENVKLQHLDCSRNTITQLDLPDSMNLRHLDCSRNKLDWLDVSYYRNLLQLHCQHNSMQHLWLQGCNGLVMLDCSNNNIQDKDVRNYLALQHFYSVYQRQ